MNSGPLFRRAALALSLCGLALQTCATFAQQEVLTYHNDNQRTGQALSETTLTPANVNQSQFGQVFSHNVDGWIVGQPLYVQNVTIPNLGAHNVVYVATLHDSVYAFDADSATVNGGAALWQVSFINPAGGITTVDATVAGCNNVTKFTEQGIIGTPAIDPTSNTMYLVAKTQENGSYFQRLHALDITTGQERAGSPVVITATVPGSGDGSTVDTFDPLGQMSRTGVLVANNTVYLTFSANGCKQVHNHGWVFAYDATSLAQTGVFNTTPNTNNGGIWQGGSGPAADSDGNIYLETADANFDQDSGGGDYGDSILKFNPNLTLSSFFTPNTQASLNNNDYDLASTGPLVLPDQLSFSHPHLVVGSGKDETIYLLDRSGLGNYNPLGDQIVQEVAPFFSPIRQRFGAPTYWNNKLYFTELNAQFIAYSFNNGVISSAPVDQGTTAWARTNPMSISAQGNSNGILWLITSLATSAQLRAYDPTFLGTEFYDSDQAGSRDTLGPIAHFMTPAIANGRVYVGTQTRLAAYGLLSTTPAIGLSPTSLTFSGQNVNTTSAPQTITLTNTGSGSLSVNSVTSSGDFGQTNTCTTNVAVGATCLISVIFTPTVTGTQTGTITITDNAGNSPQTVSLSGTGTVGTNNTTTTVSSSQNPSSFGQSVTFTATVTASGGIPTGSVTFFDGASNLGTINLDGAGRAGLSLSSLTAGSHSLSASYGGNSSFSSSTSAPFTQTVNAATTTALLASSVSPAVVNQPVTVTATITTQFGGITTGSITFKDGVNILGSASPVGNVATITTTTLSKGNHSLSASYSGDPNFSGCNSNNLPEAVNQASTTTAVTSTVNPSVANQSTTFKATVTGQFGGTPTGTITFKSGTLSLGRVNLSGGSASLIQTFTTSGARSITALYSSDVNFTASTSPTLSQVVNAAPTSTAVSSNLNPSNFGNAVTFTAAVTSSFGTPTGSVTFKAGNTTLGTANLSAGAALFTTSSLVSGTKSITAIYVGNANFSTSTSLGFSQTVNRLNTTSVLTSSVNPSNLGQSLTFTTTVSSSFGTPTGNVNFKDGSTIIGSATLSGGKASFTTSTLAQGSHNIGATFVQSGNYNGSTGTLVQKVN
jgi:hypothetical protein